VKVSLTWVGVLLGVGAAALGVLAYVILGPVDKPVLAPVEPERLGRCNIDLATGMTR
jgi:biotin transporter BioY